MISAVLRPIDFSSNEQFIENLIKRSRQPSFKKMLEAAFSFLMSAAHEKKVGNHLMAVNAFDEETKKKWGTLSEKAQKSFLDSRRLVLDYSPNQNHTSPTPDDKTYGFSIAEDLAQDLITTFNIPGDDKAYIRLTRLALSTLNFYLNEHQKGRKICVVRPDGKNLGSINLFPPPQEKNAAAASLPQR